MGGRAVNPNPQSHILSKKVDTGSQEQAEKLFLANEDKSKHLVVLVYNKTRHHLLP